MKRLYNIKLIFLLLFVWIAAGCDVEDSEADPALSFVKVYDDNRFESSYQPIDIVQTSDNGFLILASRQTEDADFPSAYLMKIDEEGNFV